MSCSILQMVDLRLERLANCPVLANRYVAELVFKFGFANPRA